MSTGERYQLYSNAVPGQTGHDVILNSLDTWRDHNDGSGNVRKLWFGTENFAGTESDWSGTRLIYGARHPKTPYTVNSATALLESDGRDVGSFVDPELITVGSPRFGGKFTFTDPEVQALHDSGELQFSSGFISDITDDGKLSGKVTPDHILVFKKTKDGLQPQDKATLFLNAVDKNMTEHPEIAGLFTQILEAIKSLSPAKREKEPVMNAIDGPNMTEDFTQKIAVLNATIEANTASITERDATIADLTTQLEGFKTAQEQAANAAQEAAWQTIKTDILAPGLTATPELEAEQKDKWMKDKDGFYCNAISAAATRPPAKGKAGEMFANATGVNEDAEYDAIVNDQPGIPGRLH